MKFGAMLTDASAFWAEKMTDEHLSKQLEKLDVIRFSLGPSDFSRSVYNWGDRQKHHIDPEEKLKIEVLARIARITNGRITFIAGPWAPPKRLLVRGRSHTEDDIDEPVNDWFHHYAEVLSKWAELYADHGVKIEYLSLQNEPLYATSDYPSKLMTADEEVQLRKALHKVNPNIKVALYDHNPDDAGIEFVKTLIKEGAVMPGDITAWHHYSGNIDSINTIPEIKSGALPAIISEISATVDEFGDYARTLKYYQGKVSAAKAAGCKMFLYHNLFLDEQGGPNQRQAEQFLEEPLFTVFHDLVNVTCEVKSSSAALEAFQGA